MLCRGRDKVSGNRLGAGRKEPDRNLTPMQAVFERGGFTTTAQVDSVILIRDAAAENPKIGRLNSTQAAEDGVPERVTLLDNDVIYVPMSG